MSERKFWASAEKFHDQFYDSELTKVGMGVQTRTVRRTGTFTEGRIRVLNKSRLQTVRNSSLLFSSSGSKLG